MTLRCGKHLDLLWRIVGCNVLIILIAILQMSQNPELSSYVLFSNIYLVCYLFFQVLKRKLTMTTNMKEILVIYSICKLVINFVLIENIVQCTISIFCSLLESLWIAKFYMLAKKQN